MTASRALKDRYGFWFWMRWILWFCGAFVLSAAGWTWFLGKLFGEIVGPELTITWCVASFGTWFLLVIPFMRKKEQIWKRLNEDQERSVDAWFQGMGIFIGFLVVTCLFWSLSMRQMIRNEGLDAQWTKRVFITWLVTLIPFLIYMYRQADAIFKRAHERQTYAPRYKVFYLPPEQRHLSQSLIKKLKKMPQALPKAHVVNVILKNGEVVRFVFIKQNAEIAGIYGRSTPGFCAGDIADIEWLDPKHFPVFEESEWLRLDVAEI